MFNSFEEFIASSSTQVPLFSFILNILLSAILSITLGKFYISFGKSLSNRKFFSNNFLLITMTTMLIITVVKSSLALSLGLVGALSIIRFRSAIKEPEELAYLFLAISIGLGFGANQAIITLTAFIIILSIIYSVALFEGRDPKSNLYVTISSSAENKVSESEIIQELDSSCNMVKLVRLDESSVGIEMSLLVEFKDFEGLVLSKNAIKEKYEDISISFLDNNGIYQ